MISVDLQFKLAKEKPKSGPVNSNDYIIYNRCEGYSLGRAVFDDSGCFLYFSVSCAGEIVPYLPEYYDLWAHLPNSLKLGAIP